MFYYFKKVDLYGKQQEILINGQESISSWCSICISLSVFSLILAALGFFSADLITRAEPILFDSFRQTNDPPAITLEKGEYVFAFIIDHPIKFIPFMDPEIYTVKAYQVAYIFNPPNPFIYQETELPVTTCNKYESHLFENEASPQFVRSSYYCINADKLVMAGAYGASKRWDFVQIRMEQCDEKTSKCKSAEERKEALDGGSLGMFVNNVNFNPSEFLKPLSRFVENVYTTNTIGRLTEYTLYYSVVEVFSDIGYIYEDFEQQSDIRLESDIKRERGDQGNYMANIMIRMATRQYEYRRIYKKIHKILADTGGISNVIRMIGLAISSFFLTGTRSFEMESMIKPSLIKTRVEKVEVSASRFRISNSGNNFVKHKTSNELKQTIVGKVKSLCCQKRKLFSREQIKYMDWQFLIKSLKEIQILKYVLLTEKQNKIVSFFNIDNPLDNFSQLAYVHKSDITNLPQRFQDELNECLKTVSESNDPNDRKFSTFI